MARPSLPLFALLALGVFACREQGARVAPQREPGPSVASAPPSGRAPERLRTVTSAEPSRGPAPGSTVRVRARHPSGVPLHPGPGAPEVSGRIADGSAVRIEAAQEGRWFEISQGSQRGWVTRRYLAVEAEPEATKSVDSGSPFASSKACLAALGRGERLSKAERTARLGSWNLHWFPDKKPGKPVPDGEGTDLEWLACAITWLDFDAVAVQELKGTAPARARLGELLRLLDARTGGKWRAEVDDCGAGSGQHVGVLFDEKRARLGASGTLGQLNPHGEPCKDQLRPGLGVYLRFPGGLDVHVVSAHLKAGGARRDFDLRQRSFENLSELWLAAQALAKDDDVLVIGDLNTMGCPECSAPVSAEGELAAHDARLAGEGFRRLTAAVPCSFYHDGAGTLLDGALASAGFRELAGDAQLGVGGPCAELGCSVEPARGGARKGLSDHCPVYVDVPDHDRD